MSNVLLLRNFIEDKRTSMEIYAENLLKAFPGQDSSLNIRYYRPATRFSNNGTAGKWAMRYARYIEYPAQIKRFKAHLYHINEHGYAHLIKNLPAERTIVTVHDLIPFLKHSGAIKGVKPENNPRLSRYSLSFLNQAAHLISVSENTKNDLIKYCGCSAEKISVVYHGLADMKAYNNQSKLNARKELNLSSDDEKLVLVSGQDFYKNLDSSIYVYNKLRKKYNIRLIHLGQRNSVWQQAKSLADAPESIIEFAHLPFSMVINLYRAVDCLLFPSWYEGFGLPPLEAMACGTPVVTSNTASLPEVVGDAALTADPDDIDGLSKAVESLLFDEDIRSHFITKGLTHAQNFSWTKCAQQTLEVYRKTLSAIN